MSTRLYESYADDRAEWVNIAHDLHPLGNDGKKLFHKFSKKSGKYEKKAADELWDGITDSKSHPNNIFVKAQNAGWKNPKKARKVKNSSSSKRLQFIPIATAIKKQSAVTDWLIKDYFEAETVASIIAKPASYKSFSAVDIGCSIASGLEWHGHKVPKTRSVGFLIGEGLRGFNKRLQAWGIANDMAVEDLPISISDRAGDLSDDVEEVIESLEAINPPPELVIIDTLSRNFGSADENLSKDMQQFVKNVDKIKDHFNCAILIIHHTPLSTESRGRGSTVLHGALEFQYLIKKPDGSNSFTLTCSKAKDHPEPEDKHFIATSIELPETDEEGVPITSLVIESGHDYSGSKSGLGKNQKQVLDKITRLIADKSKQSNESELFVEINVSEVYDESWMSKQSVYSAINGLVNRDLICKQNGVITLNEF